MNYKVALSAAFVAAVGLTGCDSRNTTRDADSRNVDSGNIQSGTTSPGASANAPIDINNTRGTGTQEGDYANVNADREKDMTDRKVNPDHARRAKPAQPTSGATSGDSADNEMILERNDSDEVAANNNVYHSSDDSDHSVSSGSTSEVGEPQVSYSRTEYPGGIAPEDRNLRYGLIGNGTGMGLEDSTSKFLTDNHTLADPKLRDQTLAGSGALSAPTDDQDALKDIKSGSSYEQYDVED